MSTGISKLFKIYKVSRKMLDSSQIASGVAVLLSFFVGYKYGIKFTTGEGDDECEKRNKPSTSSADEKMGKACIYLLV